MYKVESSLRLIECTERVSKAGSTTALAIQAHNTPVAGDPFPVPRVMGNIERRRHLGVVHAIHD